MHRPLICRLQRSNGKLVAIACIAMPEEVHLRPALPISVLAALERLPIRLHNRRC